MPLQSPLGVPVLLATLLLSACEQGGDHGVREICADPEGFSKLQVQIPEAAAKFILEQTQVRCNEPNTYCKFALHERSKRLGAFGVSVTYVQQESGSRDCIFALGDGHTWYFNSQGEPTHDFPAM